MEPHLFDEAVDAQLGRLAAEAATDASPSSASGAGSSELTLYRRIADVKRRSRSASLQDLLYMSVLRRFHALGVDLLPPMSQISPDFPGHADLVALTKGVHSEEALELVREHLGSVLGGGQAGAGAPPPFGALLIRMSKLQAAQVYAASLMFGYFLRRGWCGVVWCGVMGRLRSKQTHTQTRL